MFKFFENLVDPYCAYPASDHPPQRLWPFLLAYAQPFKRVFAVAAVMSVVVAVIEIGLIWAMGWVVDILAGSPEQVWQDYGGWLIALAVFLLVLRPVLQAVDVALLNNTILPNFGTLIRFRAHAHVLRQSVGWFENDFAGRIANRIMQTPPAAGEAVFQVFDAITFSLAYAVGAVVLLGQADWRLSLPLLAWAFSSDASGRGPGSTVPSALPEITASLAFASTVVPSGATISVNTPPQGAGTSTETLSVSNSHSISSWLTLSPTCLNQVATVASVTLSPNVGTITSVEPLPPFAGVSSAPGFALGFSSASSLDPPSEAPSPASSVASSASTPTVSPSSATISASVPAAGEGTSTVTLSVSSSQSISSTATESPGFLNQVAMVASVTLSPRVGTRTSTDMDYFPSIVSASLTSAACCSLCMEARPVAGDAAA